MRTLFVTGGGPATVFALAPLATAARAAGHQVFMAANHEIMPAVTASGLPALPVTDQPLAHFISRDRAGRAVPMPLGRPIAEQSLFTGRWFARMAAASLPPLLRFGERWRPDLVVGGTTTYAAALLARHLGVPYVRAAWDAIDARRIHPGADGELAPELTELGLERVPEPDLFVDVCPPSLRPEGAAPAQPMRFALGNRHRELEPWMYTRPEGRRRICLTAGSQVTRDGAHKLFEFLARAVRELKPLDAELLIACPDALAPGLREACGDALGNAGWMPLDVVARTCDLLVHHGGGVTTLTAMTAGVPQVVVPGAEMLADTARRVAGYGAAVTLPTCDETPDAVGAACHQVLSDTGFAERARHLSAEIAALPTPHDVVGRMTGLTRG